MKKFLNILNINPLSGLDIANISQPCLHPACLVFAILPNREHLSIWGYQMHPVLALQSVLWGLVEDLFYTQSQNILLHFLLFTFMLLTLAVGSGFLPSRGAMLFALRSQRSRQCPPSDPSLSRRCVMASGSDATSPCVCPGLLAAVPLTWSCSCHQCCADLPAIALLHTPQFW